VAALSHKATTMDSIDTQRNPKNDPSFARLSGMERFLLFLWLVLRLAICNLHRVPVVALRDQLRSLQNLMSPAVSPAKITAPLDLGFTPAAVFNHDSLSRVQASNQRVPMVLGSEHGIGLTSPTETAVNPEADSFALRHVEHIVKFHVGTCGGKTPDVGGLNPIHNS